MKDHFPLLWPNSHEPSKAVKREKYTLTTLKEAGSERLDIDKELNLLNASNTVLASNAKLNARSGKMLPRQKVLAEPGVALFFQFRGLQYALACDRYSSLAANLRAISTTLNSLRTIGRYHSDGMLLALFRPLRFYGGTFQRPGPQAAPASSRAMSAGRKTPLLTRLVQPATAKASTKKTAPTPLTNRFLDPPAPKPALPAPAPKPPMSEAEKQWRKLLAIGVHETLTIRLIRSRHQKQKLLLKPGDANKLLDLQNALQMALAALDNATYTIIDDFDNDS